MARSQESERRGDPAGSQALSIRRSRTGAANLLRGHPASDLDGIRAPAGYNAEAASNWAGNKTSHSIHWHNAHRMPRTRRESAQKGNEVYGWVGPRRSHAHEKRGRRASHRRPGHRPVISRFHRGRRFCTTAASCTSRMKLSGCSFMSVHIFFIASSFEEAWMFRAYSKRMRYSMEMGGRK